MRLFLFSVTLLKTFSICAQFSIPEPVINTGIYTITDTVYMDPNGNDTYPGTFSQPVKSFNVAVQKLPYGTVGVNEGNAYGLIMLKPGYYETQTGFQQYANTWQSGNVYRNISVEGIGEVIIGGTPNSFATGHLLVLSGNHIFIKNIKLKYTTGTGLLMSRNNSAVVRQHNILIDNVHVDSVGGFSMLLKNTDTILVRNSSSFYSSRPGHEHLTSPCSWPSGIKFYNSTNCIIHDSEIAYTRGEGLNFHNSQRGRAYRNKLHDNGLNFYNDNSAKLMVHHNHIYNTPGTDIQLWRNCPSDNSIIWAPTAFLIANEGACSEGNGPVFENCQTKCSFPTEFFPNVDSIFIYNNIIQNVGRAFGFWQGVIDIAGVNCIKNVFIFNNTVIGTMGMPGAPNNALVNVFFPDYNVLLNSFYSYMQNVQVTRNIFAFDTASYTNMRSVMQTWHGNHPGPKDINFNYNLLVKNHNFKGPNDLIRQNLPGSTYILTDSLNSILPCPDNQEFIYSSPLAFAFLSDDYNNKPRTASETNVGALEYNITCTSGTTGISSFKALKPQVYPNPCSGCQSFFINNLPSDGDYSYRLYSMIGSEVHRGFIKNNQIMLNKELKGIYILMIEGNSVSHFEKLIID
jgi:hypothetical protein